VRVLGGSVAIPHAAGVAWLERVGSKPAMLRGGETAPEGVAELLDRPCGERAVRQLLLLGPVEQGEEGRYLRLRPHRPAAGPPAVALLEPNEIRAIVLTQGRLVSGKQRCELDPKLLALSAIRWDTG
jgi:hypothetical protein